MGVTIPYVDIPDPTKRLKGETQTDRDRPTIIHFCLQMECDLLPWFPAMMDGTHFKP